MIFLGITLIVLILLMEIYVCDTLLDNIYLKKYTIDTNQYNVTTDNSGNILLTKKRIIVVPICDAGKHNYKKSKITNCTINGTRVSKLNYRNIICAIYNVINDGVTIIGNSILNIKTIKKEDEGFYYIDAIGISVQGVESNKAMREIINQCSHHNIQIVLNITLLNKSSIVIDNTHTL